MWIPPFLSFFFFFLSLFLSFPACSPTSGIASSSTAGRACCILRHHQPPRALLRPRHKATPHPPPITWSSSVMRLATQEQSCGRSRAHPRAALLKAMPSDLVIDKLTVYHKSDQRCKRGLAAMGVVAGHASMGPWSSERDGMGRAPQQRVWVGHQRPELRASAV